jgi:hypothetical protein
MLPRQNKDEDDRRKNEIILGLRKDNTMDYQKLEVLLSGIDFSGFDAW